MSSEASQLLRGLRGHVVDNARVDAVASASDNPFAATGAVPLMGKIK